MAVCTNINPLYNNYFLISFGRGTKQLELLCQKANLPSIKIPDIPQPTTLGTTIPVPSLMAQFDPLNVEFIVDENMTNWKSIYSWIRNITNIKDDESYNLDYDRWHIDAKLQIFAGPYEIERLCTTPTTVIFKNVVPISLTGLNFQSDNTDTVIQKASASFRYSYYYFNPEPININP